MAIYTTYAQFRTGFATSATIGTDGFRVWPGAEVEAATTLQITFTAQAVFPITVSVDQSSDPTPGVDRYDWYLSQRTDVPARQYLSIVRDDPLPATESGTVVLSLTALATGLFGAAPFTMNALLGMFTDTDIYVQQKSTGAIQHATILDIVTGDGDA